jgi:hypothetical protein
MDSGETTSRGTTTPFGLFGLTAGIIAGYLVGVVAGYACKSTPMVIGAVIGAVVGFAIELMVMRHRVGGGHGA